MQSRLLVLILFITSYSTHCSYGQLVSHWGPDGYVKIEEGSGGFFANLDSGDRFSRDHDQAGDINGDGVIDLVVGARSDDDGATDAGAVYILFMNVLANINGRKKRLMAFKKKLPFN